SIYNTLPFVKVNPWYFSFFSQKSELHFGNLGNAVNIGFGSKSGKAPINGLYSVTANWLL
ncbi:MAG: hypothetical protein UHL70_05710, partial [Acutalibacteraceae bacterium]|nr:hypothetical protein [Acutalibacteraceae bacterium]